MFFFFDTGFLLLLWQKRCAFKVWCVLWRCMKLLFEWHYLIFDFHNVISKGSCLWSRIPIHILSCLVEPRLLLISYENLSQQCWPSSTHPVFSWEKYMYCRAKAMLEINHMNVVTLVLQKWSKLRSCSHASSSVRLLSILMFNDNTTMPMFKVYHFYNVHHLSVVF